MLERLSQGPASVSELGKPLASSLAAVLQHVQILEASGLVQSRKLGRTRTCSLDTAALRSAEELDLPTAAPSSSGGSTGLASIWRETADRPGKQAGRRGARPSRKLRSESEENQ